MIRKILILIFVSIILAGCMTGEPEEQGTLQLTSSPAGAEIYLDNQYRGTTPGTISGVGPGSHTLEFRMKGYKSWKSVITVSPGTANYVAAMSVLPDTGTDIVPVVTAEPVAVTIQAGRDKIIVGDLITFSGIATGTDSVGLSIIGPGRYTNGVVLDSVRPDASDHWSYTWNPGTKIQSGTYTVIASDAGRIVSGRTTFTVTGDGIVSVVPSSYAVVRGEPVIFSGRCTTGAPAVRVILSGPDRFGAGVDLGNVAVNADQSWSLRYVTDLTMPAGIYAISVSDIPQSTTASAQFTIGFAT